jgi:hemoglobin
MRIWIAAIFLVSATAIVRADEKPLERTELDKRVVATVYESAKLGTEVFNKGAHGECFRLYQGTLLAVVPMLDHRPKLQASVKKQLEAANAQKPVEGAFALRAALDEIQNEIAPAKVDNTKKALWDRLGGQKAVEKVVNDFVLAAVEDKKVNFLRDGKVKIDTKGVEALKKSLVEMISSATGGPLKYNGKNMKDAHKGMAITDAEFDALAAVLIDVLKKNNVPQAEIDELIKIVGTTRADIVEKK